MSYPSSPQTIPYKCLLHGTLIPQQELVQHLRSIELADCPCCQKPCYRKRNFQRRVWDLDEAATPGPRLIEVIFSQHYCCHCSAYFMVPLTDLGLSKCQYTQRVIQAVLHFTKAERLSYRDASLHFCREHGICIPFATIRNWQKTRVWEYEPPAMEPNSPNRRG